MSLLEALALLGSVVLLVLILRFGGRGSARLYLAGFRRPRSRSLQWVTLALVLVMVAVLFLWTLTLGNRVLWGD